MGYNVKIANIDAAYDQFDAYGNHSSGTLVAALEALRESVRELTVMRSFKGSAAESAKAYFGDVYPVLIDQMECLMDQLRSDYAAKYMKHYSDQPIFERGDALLPEEELEQKRALVARAKDERVPSVRNSLNAAASALPRGVWFSMPNTMRLQGALNGAHGEIEQLKNEVGRAEEDGARVFDEQSGLFSTLKRAIEDEIRSTSGDLAAYEPGGFFVQDAVIAASLAFKKAAADQQANQGAMIRAHNLMLDRQLLREEEVYRTLEEGRSQWELVGIGASVVATLAAAAAIVGTGGAAAALIAGVGAYKAASSTFTRVSKRVSNENASDNPAGDTTASTKSKVATSSVIAASSTISRILKDKDNPTRILNASAKTAVSLTGKASQAVTVLADANHDSMRQEAQMHLKRIEELKAKRINLSNTSQAA